MTGKGGELFLVKYKAGPGKSGPDRPGPEISLEDKISIFLKKSEERMLDIKKHLPGKTGGGKNRKK